MLVKIPFGKGFEECEVEDSRIHAYLEPSWPTPGNPDFFIENALSNPIGSKSLDELAEKAGRILIITSDNTRPVPSKTTLPRLIAKMKKASPQASIRLLVATGLHEWSPSGSELKEKFGQALDYLDEFIIHSAKNIGSLVNLGSLSTGNRLYVNTLLKEADLVVSEGYIEGHFFAGFTGGPKSILPGVSGVETIMNNHSPGNIDHPNARCGVAEGNPIYEEMLEAANMAKLRFILNVVLDGRKRMLSAFAGDPLEAHRSGRVFTLKYCGVKPVPGDIVITSNGGYPLDRNLYQLVKGISNGALTAREDGVIVACGECVDGVGHQGFYEMLASSSSPGEFLRRLRSGEIWREAQWEAQVLARVLEKFRVIVVSRGVDSKTVESMHMMHAKSLKEGLEIALSLKPLGRITLLPDGPSTIPLPQ
ncbi:MAG: nickel-dependent lactate racemase [Candidatus Brockarchaeota archaeon]|nr:nickel-dependent lactate racemase [Candidatus Brockarchaeota archaeon]MBO3840852.1 nickel-dependent lactate racemase [Candidatus Brockarchaeota archaeon]